MEFKAFKTRIYPSTKQIKQFRKAFGTRRWIWNWAIETYFNGYKQGVQWTAYKLDTEINRLRSKDPDKYGWIGDVNTMVKSEAIKDFGISLQAWLKRLKKHSHEMGIDKESFDIGKPKFRSRKDSKQSFRLFKKAYNTFQVKGKHTFNFNWTCKYGHMNVLTRESIAFLKDKDIKTMTIEMVAGRYYMSVVYASNKPQLPHGTGTVGLDLGIKHAVVTFNGTESETFDIPQTIRKYEKQQERFQRKLSRMTYGSKNYEKQKLLVERACQRQANSRRDFLDKLTYKLVTTYDTIKVDDFSFNGAMNLKRSRRALLRVAPSSLKYLLEIKCENHGVKLFYIPKGTPTTQVCSHCGQRPQKRIDLGARTYKCTHCGTILDRDENAARNVYKYEII